MSVSLTGAVCVDTDSVVWCRGTRWLWRTSPTVPECDRAWSTQTDSWVSFGQCSVGAGSTQCPHTCSCHPRTWVGVQCCLGMCIVYLCEPGGSVCVCVCVCALSHWSTYTVVDGFSWDVGTRYSWLHSRWSGSTSRSAPISGWNDVFHLTLIAQSQKIPNISSQWYGLEKCLFEPFGGWVLSLHAYSLPPSCTEIRWYRCVLRVKVPSWLNRVGFLPAKTCFCHTRGLNRFKPAETWFKLAKTVKCSYDNFLV